MFTHTSVNNRFVNNGTYQLVYRYTIALVCQMKGMMKSVSENLVRYEHIKYQMSQLSLGIIKEMNEMYLFYRENPYSETNKKAHLETEVINLYNANKKRLVKAGVPTTYLEKFTTNNERKELGIQKRIADAKTQPPHAHDYIDEYDPRNRHAEPPIMYEKEIARSRDHPHQTTSQSDKRVSGNPEGRIREKQKDPVFKRNGRDSPDISDDDERHDDDSNASYDEYLRTRGLDKLSEYGYHI